MRSRAHPSTGVRYAAAVVVRFCCRLSGEERKMSCRRDMQSMFAQAVLLWVLL
jgi:cytochrome b561